MGRPFDTAAAIEDESISAAAVVRLLADVIDKGATGLVIAIEQSTVSVAALECGGSPPRIGRDELPARELPKTRVAQGVGIPISMAAYARAFEPKIRWEAAVFDERPGIDTAPQFPPRVRVDDSGALADRVPPRAAAAHRHCLHADHDPHPGPRSAEPYSLAVVQLDDSPVRVLLKVTGVPAGETTIGQAGSVVLRKIATRSGIPDYGYAFWPGRTVVGARA